uniref:Uncharacterized protein n=1 Tax=Oryza punctata TaxID=4537 RepID=A0A0E0MFA4_ORYPU
MDGVDATVAASDEAGETMHVVMFPFLVFGHINPFAQLARKMVGVGVGAGVRVMFLLTVANMHRIEAMLGGASTVAALELPRVPGLPEGAESTAEVSARGRRPLGVKAALFSIFTAVSGAYVMVPAHRRLRGPARPTVYDLASAPEGFPPSSSLTTVPAYQATDFSYVFKSFHGMSCMYDRVAACHNASDALVIKSCAEMEGPYIDYIAAQHGKPVLVTRPIMPEPLRADLEERWATWLSSFPDNSKLFIQATFWH